MEFFCAKCQRKHSARHIGFNIWSICSEEAATRVGTLVPNEDSAEALSRFCRSELEARKAFVLVGDQIPGLLKDRKVNNDVISGTVSLTLEWLLDAYDKYSEAAKEAKIPRYDIPEELLGREVYSQYMQFTYEKIEEEYVLSNVKDEHSDPFTSPEGIMRGFRRCCPEGHEISEAVGKAKEFIIALAGSPRAGKTTCITAITQALRDGRYAQSFGMSMEAFNGDPQWRKLEEEIEKYKRGHAVEKTPLDNDNLTYSILIKMGGARRVLTFVDMPGEFWQNNGMGLDSKWYTQYAGIYENLDCIWFFISKWTAYNAVVLTDERREELQKQTAERVELIQHGSASNLGQNLRSLQAQLKAKGKRMPPIAVILTKGDVEMPLEDISVVGKYNIFPVADGRLAPPAAVVSASEADLKKVLTYSREKRRFHLNEHAYWLQARAIRSFLQSVNNGTFCTAIEESCPDRTYISLAAYGHPAINPEGDASGTPIAPTPFHEVYPLIWTFAILGALPVEHHCEWFTKDALNRVSSDAREIMPVVFSYHALGKAGALLADPPKGGLFGAKKVEAQLDNAQILVDIGANLLMEANGKDPAYRSTKLQHKRR